MKNADMPAIPVLEPNNISEGVTKREMFAMYAMSACLNGILSNPDPLSKITPSECAEIAVGYADALLAELDK